MSSTTLPNVRDPSPWSADHLCDDCSNMGHEIRQLCEVKGSKISKSRALVEKNRSTCAFCGVIASRFELESGESEGEIDIYLGKRQSRSSRSGFHYVTEGIDQLGVFCRKETAAISMDVLTTESENLFLLLSFRERCLWADR